MTELQLVNVQATRLSDTLFKITVTQNTDIGRTVATCFDSSMYLKSIPFGGDLFEDGSSDTSMVYMSLDNVTFTRVCGHKSYIQICEGLQEGESVDFYLKVQPPTGVSFTGEKLSLVIIPSLSGDWGQV